MLIDNAKSVRISNNSRSRQKKTVLRKNFYSQDKALKSIEMSTSNYFYILVFYVNSYRYSGKSSYKDDFEMYLNCTISYTDITPRRE